MAWGSIEDFRLLVAELPDGFERGFESQRLELLGIDVG